MAKIIEMNLPGPPPVAECRGAGFRMANSRSVDSMHVMSGINLMILIIHAAFGFFEEHAVDSQLIEICCYRDADGRVAHIFKDALRNYKWLRRFIWAPCVGINY